MLSSGEIFEAEGFDSVSKWFTAKVLRWLIFSIIFSLLPLGLDYLMALSRSKSPSGSIWADVIGRGELCLIAVTLSAVGAGEMYGTQLKGERLSVILGGASLINTMLGVALYVMMKSAADTPSAYILFSIIIFFSTLVVATSCIAASETKGV
ncbi:hypothetical protein BA190_24040 [Labrys sp. WJW]|nr:hypothetical protein BA190_24040 [Labrys sp. WJW]